MDIDLFNKNDILVNRLKNLEGENKMEILNAFLIFLVPTILYLVFIQLTGIPKLIMKGGMFNLVLNNFVMAGFGILSYFILIIARTYSIGPYMDMLPSMVLLVFGLVFIATLLYLINVTGHLKCKAGLRLGINNAISCVFGIVLWILIDTFIFGNTVPL